jgi:hypothetical protein
MDLALSKAYGDEVHSYTPPGGFVPDAQTAIRIAQAILVPIYGDESIEREKPLVATLDGNVWTVRGTLPPGSLGGTAIVEISKADARVLRVSHGK